MILQNIIPIIFGGLMSFYVTTVPEDAVKTISQTDIRATGEAPLNQKARYEWEFQRLKDPATGKIPHDAFQQSLAYAQTLPGSPKKIADKKERTLSDKWDLRGPINIGGRTRALAIDVLNENILLSGGVSGGMWRSVDGGKNWIKTTRPDQLQSTSCIAQDKRKGKENIWYVGTGEYFNIYGGLRGDGVYKSTDGGQSWFQLESTLSNSPNSWDAFDYVWNIVTDHTRNDSDIVLTATAVGAIRRSADGGQTWKTVLGGFGNTYSWFTDIAISPSGVYYATLSQKTFGESAHSSVKGIYRSTNGINWVNITPEIMPQRYNRVVIGISPSDENQVYFLAETPGTGKMTRNSYGDSLWHSIFKYTYISGDGTAEGGKWEDRSVGLPCPARIRSQFNSQGGYDLVVAVKPDNPEVVFVGGTNLYRSTDGFRSEENTTHIGGYCWDDTSCYEVYTYTNHHADQHAIIFLPSDPNVMFSGSDGGVAKTLNNMQEHVDWESLNRGYYTTQFYTCAIDHATSGSNEIIGGLQDNGTLYTNSANLNKDWTSPAGADGFHCAIADFGTAHYTSNNASQQPFIKIWRKKLDENGYPTISTRIDPDGVKDMIWNTPFRLDPNDTRRMYLAGGRMLWRNNNLDLIPVEESKDSTSIGWDSLSYTRVDSNNAGAGRDERITAVVVSKNPANIVYYGTSYGRLFRLDNANEGNPIPSNITDNQFPKLSNIGCVAVNPHDANKLFCVFTNFNIISIFYSEDGGQNWTNVSGNLEQYPSGSGAGPAVYWVEVLPVGNEYRYFAGTSTGIYSTSHLEGKYTVWQQEAAESIGNAMVYMLDSRQSDNYLTAATFGLGMFSANYNSTIPKPNPPVLIEPKNDSTGILETVDLTWSNVENAYYYYVQLSKNKDFDSIYYEQDGLNTTNLKIYNLTQGLVKYYWRVFARSAGGLSIPSEIRNFETAVAPPELISPPANATDIELPVTLSWNDTSGINKADAYHLQLSENVIFTKILLDTIVQEKSLDYSNLKSAQRYYWRVSGIKNNQEGIASKHFNFKTKEVVSVDDILEKNGLTILGNFPNPFDEYSELKFFTNKDRLIKISLFDATGRKIVILKNDYFTSGEHIIRINTRNLSQGEYFIMLESDKFTLQKKINVVK
ncbi:T9SS C-terminal target domain-containing protein [Bacteroidetes/Chlorobi group bacterium ChocPot_Mid]|nr:MAG: T9SS C-terminal target domain-containing protein [Bacteroidetes/Chlorobi group bacterium ChocPot_Mid]